MFFRRTAITITTPSFEDTRSPKSPSTQKLREAMQLLLPKIKFTGSHEPIRVSFGSLKISDGVSVPLAGLIECPFPFINRAVSETLAAAHEELWAWSLGHGFFEDSKENRSAFDRYNLVQFTAYTVLSIPEVTIDVYSEIKDQGKSVPDVIKSILETATPLKTDQLLRQSKYLLWLFRHDNWAETHSNPHFIKEMHNRFLRALRKGKQEPLTENSYKTIHPKGTDSELKFMNSLITGIADIGMVFKKKFTDLIGNNNGPCFGYQDFVDSVERYLEAQATEATCRVTGTTVSPNYAKRIRQEACGVYTVNYAALAECNQPIPKHSPALECIITRIAEAFSDSICHLNDLISAPRETDKPNWQNNEIQILFMGIKEIMGENSSEDTEKAIQNAYQRAVSSLFRKITSDFKDALQDIEEISTGNFGSDQESTNKETVNKELIPLLIYIGVMQQWAIGSIPAQMALDRYSKHRTEGAYIKPGEFLNGDANFWRFVSGEKAN